MGFWTVGLLLGSVDLDLGSAGVRTAPLIFAYVNSVIDILFPTAPTRIQVGQEKKRLALFAAPSPCFWFGHLGLERSEPRIDRLDPMIRRLDGVPASFFTRIRVG